MAVAMRLAERGLGSVWPNPAVGCVLVQDGRIVGRGWTQPGGRPHGEVEALRRAGALANRVKRQRTTMDIPDASVDLVTSSMVVSQFEHEPYGYFSKQAAAVLGSPSRGEENRLSPAMEALRSTLLANQIERHLDEIERILAPGGHCFMAFEMFHVEDGTGRWFLVSEMHGALAAIAGRFDFNFDILPQSDSVALFESPGGRSVVHRFVLEPRPK